MAKLAVTLVVFWLLCALLAGLGFRVEGLGFLWAVHMAGLAVISWMTFW